MKHISTVAYLIFLSILFYLSGCNKVGEHPEQTPASVDPADPVLVAATITAVACGTEVPVSCVSSVFITEGRNSGRTCVVRELLGSRGDSVNIKTYNNRGDGSVGCNND